MWEIVLAVVAAANAIAITVPITARAALALGDYIDDKLERRCREKQNPQ